MSRVSPIVRQALLATTFAAAASALSFSPALAGGAVSGGVSSGGRGGAVAAGATAVAGPAAVHGGVRAGTPGGWARGSHAGWRQRGGRGHGGYPYGYYGQSPAYVSTGIASYGNPTQTSYSPPAIYDIDAIRRGAVPPRAGIYQVGGGDGVTPNVYIVKVPRS